MDKNKIAYAEVYSFIELLPPSEYNKIPKDIIDYINWNRDYSYNFKYDPTKTVDEQNLSKEARAIILKIYLDYFANTEKKFKIKEILKLNQKKAEQEKKLRYNPENLFKI